jgi:hypothetical protein
VTCPLVSCDPPTVLLVFASVAVIVGFHWFLMWWTDTGWRTLVLLYLFAFAVVAVWALPKVVRQ